MHSIFCSRDWNWLAIAILCSLNHGQVTSFRPLSISRFVIPSLTTSANRSKNTDHIWLKRTLQQQQLFRMKDEMKNDDDETDSISVAGKVLRLAARPFDPEHSKPSSRNYTTCKTERSEVRVSCHGVEGDYNHYRTVALKSTCDRAVSLLTKDVMDALRSEYPNYSIQNGDLGENILVEGVSFDFFRIGERYMIGSEMDTDNLESTNHTNAVILEITEKMEPCANLCKLSYINEGSLEPKQRIARCHQFIQFLDRYDGYRGWYAKVIQEGTILRGTKVLRLQN